jgi:Protein of unknown function (DUF1579)
MSERPELPQSDPAPRRFDRLVGRWTMEGNLVGSGEKNIKGETTFRWLVGGFFLEQRARIDFIGVQIDALEVIGYHLESDSFPSTVFSGFSVTPLPYRWDVQGDTPTIAVSYGQLDATVTGSWRDDDTFSGGWRTIQAPTRPRTSPATSAVNESTNST